MATTVTVHEAELQLSELLDKVEQGEEILITREGRPAVKLVPEPPRASHRLGFMEGQFTVPDDFNTMHQQEIEEMFYGKADRTRDETAA